MKIIASALALTLTFGTMSDACANGAKKTPPEVLQPYKAYRAAVKSGDNAAAMKHAKTAWQEAEARMGDSKTTGDLASNYGRLETGGEPADGQIDAMKRAMELSVHHGEDYPLMYMERGLRRVTLLSRAGRESAVKSGATKLVEFGREQELGDSTLLAEALTIMAGQQASSGKHEAARRSAEEALGIFERSTDGIVSSYSLQANLYKGYADEADEDFLGAALSYQKVMEATDGLDPEKYEVVGTTLGRWIYMRGALRTAGELETAEAQGLCQCWPYDKARNESVRPIKRVPPKMPRKAQQSGYTVVEFDLTDEGRTTNPRVVTAWPDYYERPALKALAK